MKNPQERLMYAIEVVHSKGKLPDVQSQSLFLGYSDLLNLSQPESGVYPAVVCRAIILAEQFLGRRVSALEIITSTEIKKQLLASLLQGGFENDYAELIDWLKVAATLDEKNDKNRRGSYKQCNGNNADHSSAQLALPKTIRGESKDFGLLIKVFFYGYSFEDWMKKNSTVKELCNNGPSQTSVDRRNTVFHSLASMIYLHGEKNPAGLLLDAVITHMENLIDEQELAQNGPLYYNEPHNLMKFLLFLKGVLAENQLLSNFVDRLKLIQMMVVEKSKIIALPESSDQLELSSAQKTMGTMRRLHSLLAGKPEENKLIIEVETYWADLSIKVIKLIRTGTEGSRQKVSWLKQLEFPRGEIEKEVNELSDQLVGEQIDEALNPPPSNLTARIKLVNTLIDIGKNCLLTTPIENKLVLEIEPFLKLIFQEMMVGKTPLESAELIHGMKFQDFYPLRGIIANFQRPHMKEILGGIDVDAAGSGVLNIDEVGFINGLLNIAIGTETHNQIAQLLACTINRKNPDPSSFF